mmetsp:Transcript_4755/g.7306  ORF Transcript_4755/g.7306 Transcript_4755/m.7306 type:complete len:163 (-) Transcript_4755:152-640(-)
MREGEESAMDEEETDAATCCCCCGCGGAAREGAAAIATSAPKANPTIVPNAAAPALNGSSLLRSDDFKPFPNAILVFDVDDGPTKAFALQSRAKIATVLYFHDDILTVKNVEHTTKENDKICVTHHRIMHRYVSFAFLMLLNTLNLCDVIEGTTYVRLLSGE